MTDIVHVIRATVDPSAAPTREGQHWINTATNTQWFSVGTSSVGDWQQVTDTKAVKASGTDTTAGYLAAKLTAGTGIAFTTLNPGANESISISAPGSTTDELVKISATDTTAGYLGVSLTVSNGTNATSPLEKSITSPSGDEKLDIRLDQTKLSLTASQVSDFNEAAQDTIASMLTAGIGITGTYNDPANTYTIGVTNTTVTAGSYGSASSVPNYTVNAQGQLTAATSTSIQIAESQVTSLTTDLAGKAATTTTITAGTGLSGGGDLSANRTISMANTSVTASSYGSATAIPTFTVDAQGRLTAAATSTALTPAILGAQPVDTDLTAIAALAGTGLVTRTGAGTATTRTVTAGSTQLSVTNGDGVSGNPTLDVVPGNINHNSLLNGGGNTHIDHSTVSITAGTYLSGGGDITATRTINHANSAVTAASYGGVNAIPVLTIGATGHVDAASTVNTTSALLTGLSAVLGGGTVLATDTILQALNKLVGESNNWIEISTASTYTNTSSTTGVNITEFNTTCTIGRRYYFEATLIYQTAATTTGIGITAVSPDTFSGPGALMINTTIAADGTSAAYTGTVNTLGDYVTSTGVQTANVPFVAHIKGNFPCAATGTLTLAFRSEVNGSQVTISPGSTLLIREFA